MRKSLAGGAGLAILVSLVAGTTWGQTSSTTTHHTTHTTTAVHRSLMNPASLNQKAPGTYKAKFTTTQGDFVVEVTRAWAPLGADRFYNLVKNGFFTDASFFRVISGFMAQFGFSAKPAISEKWSSAVIPDDPVTQSNKRGYITFAKMPAPNTRNTQVFINFGDNSRLDGDGFAPFGQVIEGMEVVDKLYSGYGDGPPSGSGPDQGQIEAKGKAYLDANFPKLDSIKSAVIVAPAPVTMTKKPAVASSHTAVPKPQ